MEITRCPSVDHQAEALIVPVSTNLRTDMKVYKNLRGYCTRVISRVCISRFFVIKVDNGTSSRLKSQVNHRSEDIR